MDRGPSRLQQQHPAPSTLTRRSALSLRDDFSSSSTTGGGHSLAHELVSAMEPSEGGARSLAEEFGIDLGDEEDGGEEQDSSRSESPSGSPSSHLYNDHDPQFANPNDFEPDPFSISHEFDEQEDQFNHFGHESSDFEDEQDGGNHHQGMSLGDELTLGDELEMELNGIPHDDQEDDLQTPTRAKGPRRIRSRTASSFRSQGSRSVLGFGMAPSTSLDAGPSPSASSSRSSSPSKFRSTSGSSMVDDDSDTDSPPPQRLFSSSSIPSTPNSAPSSASVQETIPLPPTFLPLLAKDDRSFELEHATASVLKTMEDMGRQREGMCRELGGLDRELQRLIAEGTRFSDMEGGEDGFGMGTRSGPMGSLVEDEDEEDGDEEDDEERSRSFGDDEDDLDDEDRSGTARLHQTHLQPSPSFSRNSTPRKSRPPNPFAPPPPSRSTPSSPSSHALLEPPTSPSLLPSISTLTTLTSSLLTSLSSLHDASQITLSSAADAGRRLRALRTTFAGMKADEEVVEKAWKSVIEWEEGEGRKKEEGGRDVKEVVEKEMAGFRKIVDDFEERTKVIRADHNRWLVGCV